MVRFCCGCTAEVGASLQGIGASELRRGKGEGLEAHAAPHAAALQRLATPGGKVGSWAHPQTPIYLADPRRAWKCVFI